MTSKHDPFNPYAGYAEPVPDPALNGRGVTKPGPSPPQPPLSARPSIPRAAHDNEDSAGEEVDMDDDDEIDQLFVGGDNVEEDDADDQAENIEMRKMHTPREIMRFQEEQDLRKKLKARMGMKKGKGKGARIWTAKGQYELVRRGIPLLEEPDACKDLSEANFFYFKHVALDDGREVEFAADPHRPLWKAVFQVPPNCGCGPDEYWNPTQSNFKTVYGPTINEDGTKNPGRDKPNQPADNMVKLRDGTRLPYWVDEWQRHKDNDQEYKAASRQKKDAQRRALLPAGPVIRPLQGAMLAHVNGKQPQHGIFNDSGFLRASLANQMVARVGPGAIRAMKRTPQKVPPKPAEPAKEPTKEQPPTKATLVVPIVQEVPVTVVNEAAPASIIEPKAVSSMLAAVQDIKRQKEEHDKVRDDLIRKQQEMADKLAQQKAHEERQKAEYAAMMATKLEALTKVFAPPAPPPSEVLPNPLASVPPPPQSSAATANGVLRNAALMRKLKNIFLRKQEEDPSAKGQDWEQVLIAFIKFLVANLADKAPEAELNALFRKARYGVAGDMDLDGMDAETTVTAYLTYVANEAGQTK